MLPEELNETSDDMLFALVDSSVVDGDQNAENLQPLASFVTLELLRRVHERVVDLKKSNRTHGTKHKLLARAVHRLTGLPIPPDDRDVDKIGNHLDIWLTRRYIQVDKKLKNVRDVQQRALQRASLQKQCCVINGWGGVSEYLPDSHETSMASSESQRTRAPYVAYTRSCLPPEVSLLELKGDLNAARDDAKATAAELERERLRCSSMKRRLESAQADGVAAMRLVELANQEKEEVNKKVRCLNQQMKSESTRLQRESAHALRDAEAQVHRLVGKVVAATREAAKHASNEEKLKSKLEKEQEVAKRDAEHFRDSLTRLRSEMARAQRESAQLLRDAEARVLRLGYQVAAAAQEAAEHAQKEEKIRSLLELEQERAEAEAEALREQMNQLRSEGRRARSESAQALRDVEAKVLRLGSQAAAAAQEAATHAQREERIRAELEQEQERAEAEAEQLRVQMNQLKSEGMRAQRESSQALRDVEARVFRLGSQAAAAAQEAAVHAQREEIARRKEEEVSIELQEAVKSSEFFQMRADVEAQTRREIAKQCAVAKAARDAAKETSLRRLQAKQAMIEVVAKLREDLDAAHEELDALREQRCDQNEAAKKISQMPTWQRRRNGKRGGGLKLEHVHRVAILEQHANGTPPSAIGKNIVSIVLKAAPWLRPVQPTVREIRQMGFELTTLEESLSARRCAAAFKVRLLGFDETTDLQQPVLTSNVQIQDTADGEVSDLVLKAAYLTTRGGTSQAIAQQIEDFCFARLRDLLRLWKAYHARMYPHILWTGPDPELCSLHRLAGGGALMSDTCNAARKTKRLLCELISRQMEAAYRTEHGDDAWESLTEEQREGEVMVYQLDCHQHLRNIMLGHMSQKQESYIRHVFCASCM